MAELLKNTGDDGNMRFSINYEDFVLLLPSHLQSNHIVHCLAIPDSAEHSNRLKGSECSQHQMNSMLFDFISQFSHIHNVHFSCTTLFSFSIEIFFNGFAFEKKYRLAVAKSPTIKICASEYFKFVKFI